MNSAPDLTGWANALRAIVADLRSVGYPFACEMQGYGPPLAPSSDQAIAALDHAEREIGPVPQLIHRIARDLGSIDLRHGRPHDLDAPLQALAGFDPLVFNLDYFATDLQEPGWIDTMLESCNRMVPLEFAPDIYHKADISGGDGPTIWLAEEPVINPASLPQLPFQDPLPPPAIALETGPIIDRYGLSLSEYFDLAIRNGGFFGRYRPGNTGDPEHARRAIANRDLGTHPMLDRLRTVAARFLDG